MRLSLLSTFLLLLTFGRRSIPPKIPALTGRWLDLYMTGVRKLLPGDPMTLLPKIRWHFMLWMPLRRQLIKGSRRSTSLRDKIQS
jgi:hypothetical protein